MSRNPKFVMEMINSQHHLPYKHDPKNIIFFFVFCKKFRISKIVQWDFFGIMIIEKGTCVDDIIYIKDYITFLCYPHFVGHWFETLNSHSFQIQPACKAARLVCSINPFQDKMRLRRLKHVHLENLFIPNISKEMSRLEFCW